MTRKSEYEVQAETFAEKIHLTMDAVYLGHYPRFGNSITANYSITLARPDRKPYRFEFSTPINDSWGYREDGRFTASKGLPPRVDTEKFFAGYLKKPITICGQYTITQTRKTPTLYDVLACLTKSDPGSFYDFCSEYGYSDDSISAEKTWRAVTEEWRAVDALFRDVLEELQEIN